MSASDQRLKLHLFKFNISDGLHVIFAIASLKLRTFLFTRFVIINGSIVSNHTIQKGADCISLIFSVQRCGA